MEYKNIRRGEAFFLASNATIYYTRSEVELERTYEDDRLRLNTMTDDGESRVHSRQGSARVSSSTTVIITRLNGSEWHGWGKKPRGLVVAMVTTGQYIGRVIAVRRQDLKTKM